jgi:GNAT superfamily N-acetyltransferase
VSVTEAPDGLRVRRAAGAEASAIAEVLRRAFADYVGLYTPEAFAATVPSAEEIERRWSEGPVWVAMSDGRVVGTVGAVARADGLYVRSLGILPPFRGQGAGRLLLGQVERFAREQGCGRLFLSTTPFLLPAIRLYERWGFRRSAHGPHELFGTPLFTMDKPLPP